MSFPSPDFLFGTATVLGFIAFIGIAYDYGKTQALNSLMPICKEIVESTTKIVENTQEKIKEKNREIEKLQKELAVAKNK